LSNKKLDWKLVLCLLVIISTCVVAYHITKEPEKNVSLPSTCIYQA
jgi:hypothetical protein